MASNRERTMEDLDLTKDEVKRLGEALKDEKFRKMLVEYAEEISDPENRRKAEEEIRMMENERGMNVQFIHPKPGHVLKTTVDGTTKAFINICQNDKIEKPSSQREKGPDGKNGLMWHIPHSFAPTREDLDKAKEKCKVFDVVFHPDTYRMSENNNRFKKLVEDTALDGIERQFSVTLDKKNIKRPKMTFKGQPVATVIRERNTNTESNAEIDTDSILGKMPYPYDNKSSSEKSALQEKNNKTQPEAMVQNRKDELSKFTVPKHTITHRSKLDMSEYRNAPDAKTSTRPNELVVKIDLPLLKSAAQLNLDIFERKIVLESTVPAAYKLDLNLPFPVNDDEGSAKFDKSKRTLTVTLPVIQQEAPELPFFHIGDRDNSENHCENGMETSPSDLITVIGDSSNIEGLENSTKYEESNKIEKNKDDSPISEVNGENKFPQHVKWLLPDYQVSQDSETVSFVIKVISVQEKSVSVKFIEQSGLRIEFMSVGAGCFPSYYALSVEFSDGNMISQKHSSVDVSDDNVVILVLKDKLCRKLWDSYSVGVNCETLEAKQFLTESNLKRDLCALDEESEKDTGMVDQEDKVFDLSVLEMQAEKLTIEVKTKEKPSEPEDNGSLSIESEPLSPSIEVVHRHPTPPLHSILKQRTVSESSEDHSLAASSNSVLSLEEDHPCCDQEEHSCSLKRRTVSFNKHIDRASFRSNASVSSMAPALKSKRKRQRKKEEKNKKAERRRRKLSGGEGTSSGEESLTRESFSDSHSVSEEEESEEKGKLFHRSVSDPGPNTEETEEEAERADNIDQSDLTSHSKELSADSSENLDNSEKSDFRTMECDKNSITGEKSCSKNEEGKCSLDWNEKVTKEIQNKLAAGKVVDKAEEECDDSDDDIGDDVNDNVKECDESLNESEKKSDVKSKSAKSEMDTMLSWEEGPQVNGTEHATRCAFQFSNTVMFDLDVD